MTRLPSARRAGTHSRAMSRAATFSPGGTESSRSTMMMSASKERARSSMFSRFPGTKIRLRINSMELVHLQHEWRVDFIIRHFLDLTSYGVHLEPQVLEQLIAEQGRGRGNEYGSKLLSL